MPGTSGISGVRLVATDDTCTALFGVGTHTVGRTSPAFEAKKGIKQFSRQQAVLVVAAGKLPVLRATGTNPTVLTEAGSATSRVLRNGAEVPLRDGDHVAFCALPQLDFEVHLVRAATDADTAAQAPKKKRARTTTTTTTTTNELTPEDMADFLDDEEADPTYVPKHHDKEEQDTRPWCKYGAACYRTNKQHLLEYRHPPK